MTWGVSDSNWKWSFALASRVFATPELAMYLGKTLFAQAMEFLPVEDLLSSVLTTLTNRLS